MAVLGVSLSPLCPHPATQPAQDCHGGSDLTLPTSEIMASEDARRGQCLRAPAQEAFGTASGNTGHLSDCLAEYFMIYINGFWCFS